MTEDERTAAPRRAWRRRTLRAVVVLAAMTVLAVAIGLNLPRP